MKTIKTTAALAILIIAATPAFARPGGGHPSAGHATHVAGPSHAQHNAGGRMRVPSHKPSKISQNHLPHYPKQTTKPHFPNHTPVKHYPQTHLPKHTPKPIPAKHYPLPHLPHYPKPLPIKHPKPQWPGMKHHMVWPAIYYHTQKDYSGRYYHANSRCWNDGHGHWYCGKLPFRLVNGVWYYGTYKWYQTAAGWNCDAPEPPVCNVCNQPAPAPEPVVQTVVQQPACDTCNQPQQPEPVCDTCAAPPQEALPPSNNTCEAPAKPACDTCNEEPS